MTVVRKYPTAYTNTDSWTNPAYLLGASDALCGSKSGVAYNTYICYLKTYGFAIPVGSTINSVKIGFKSAYEHALVFLGFRIRAAGGGTGIDSVAVGVCADATWAELDVSFLGFTVAELNNETFTSWVQVYVELDGVFGFVDCAYVEVDYTLPAVGIASKRLLVGVGL